MKNTKNYKELEIAIKQLRTVFPSVSEEIIEVYIARAIALNLSYKLAIAIIYNTIDNYKYSTLNIAQLLDHKTLTEALTYREYSELQYKTGESTRDYVPVRIGAFNTIMFVKKDIAVKYELEIIKR